MSDKRSIAMKKAWAKRKANGTDKTKKKGKWSKIARAKHSARMKERWAAKNGIAKNVVSTNKMSVNERLNIIEHHCKAIKQQLGN
jgi:hypothetical protein